MEEDFYKQVIINNGINVLIPSDEECQIMNDVIYHELCLGIILGCTEIGLLV